ncbi:MAG TPA: amidohydrolase family protein [Candidatus Kapabacteria bacterium]|nr:amidohydrolase family protein [Candidatus Kapabacteria bacterium]
MKYILAVLYCVTTLFAQTTPIEGLRDKTPDIFALKNATVVVSPTQTLEHATVVVRNGRIASVGTGDAVPADAYVIDATGKYIYPGFIEPFSDYGIPKPPAGPKLPFIDQPHPTIDRVGALSWNGAVHAERDATLTFTPDETTAEKFRSQGFCIAQTADLDGIFRGRSCVASLKVGLPNDALLDGTSYQFLSFDKGTSKQDYPSSLMGDIALIRQTFYDAQWYEQAQAAYRRNPDQPRPETNDALAALLPVLNGSQRIVFDCNDVLNLFRAQKIADEFHLSMILRGNGYEYQRLGAIKNLNDTLIIPVNFPPTPDVSTPESETEVPFSDLKKWDEAPGNAAQLAKENIPFAFTSSGLKDVGTFLKNVREAIDHGLSEQTALAAMTTVPASICGINTIAGTIEAGKVADFVVASGPIFSEKTVVYSVWIDGRKNVVNPVPEVEPRGKWNMAITQNGTAINYTLDISGEQSKPDGKILSGDKNTALTSFAVSRQSVSFDFAGDSVGMKGTVRLSGTMSGDTVNGFGTLADGGTVFWQATRTAPFVPKPDTAAKEKKIDTALFPVVYPDVAFGRSAPPDQPHLVAITNAKIWTSSDKGIIDGGTIVFGDGKIKEVGKNVSAPPDAIVIDGNGKDVSAGIIDPHSHIAISGDVNEGTHAITSEVRIGDVVNSDDINTYWQLAGGTTISQLLHGSANPIGGQCQIVKHRWGMLPEDMKMKRAPQTIKFALGENVKESNWGDFYTTRYPQTRLGVEEIIRDEFQTAREYEKKWDEWNKHPSKDMIPPRRDLQLDAIVEILNGKRFVQCHSYVQPEILMLMRLAEEFGFHISVFHHVLEGYKVAPEMKKDGAMATTFSDWWDYKFEVYDAIPYNAAMMEQEGVVTSVNSDDAEMGRRLNQEAAKSVKYGGLSEEETIKLCTINSAKQLHIEKYVGSLEPGKDADIVLWDGDPLSAHTKVLQTWIDGRKYFDREDDKKMAEEVQRERAALVAKALAEKQPPASSAKPTGKGN